MRPTARGLNRLIRVTSLAFVVGSLATLSACGSPGASAVQSALPATCEHVSAVLSDGPDPGVDPVGYAEAQIGPLGKIHTSDQALQLAIDHLDSAYKLFFGDNGNAMAVAALSKAAHSMNALCPGAAPR